MSASPFVRPNPCEDPALRVVGFHHAGGSAAVYYPMGREFPPSWELALLDLPGRGKRFAQEPLEDMEQVVDRAVRDLEPFLDGSPLALFGHSFGALVALETGRALQRMGFTPQWLGVSGRVPPNFTRITRLSELDDEELLRTMVDMGGTPGRITEVPEFVARFLRVARADLRAAESYRPDPGRPPMSCPLTVFGGTEDAWAPLPAMAGWQNESLHACRRRVLPGGHFYFLGPALKGFTRDLIAEIRTVTAVPR
ncbi:alpha/beta fold hydrolase [Streptomyces sodiiphilus]|uniref:Alpha/beta fold hydrolase n=1 Tax=Streptomyces sodiiphilus TaxID=226217 RepID=A0ABN2NXG6_9ACTN